jgi:HlyD family secretion protein
VAIPESQITFKGDSTFIEIEKAPQIFEKKYIKTGLSDGINIEILEGVTLKDKIKVPKQ